ncbi:MAG TPA: choice-of-anchor L domain-containing protein [Verrucomicrobiae bacterium]|nr:choice-of-anchor L domain-containing protein [Verrucomicrobiae bacterium]
MKNTIAFMVKLVVSMILWSFTAFSQTASYGVVSTSSLPPQFVYAVAERGPNYCIWSTTNHETDAKGQGVPVVHKYTELATGLNHLVNGQWIPSSEEIDILPDGTAAATNGQHQVYFPADIYDGEIRMVTPDGKTLQSQPLGLSYDDGSNTVLIAILTNSIGELISSNQVIYPNAFAGMDADLRYTYTKAGFEQDIILREQPPTPQSFGLNPDATRLEVLTEFFNPPRPTVKATAVSTAAGNLEDDNLSFGTMRMRRGKAFLLGTNTPSASVNKQWLTLDNRQFLVEEVPVVSIVNELSQLPQSASTQSNPPLNVISSTRLLPQQRLAKTKGKKTFIAKASLPDNGLVLDYNTINSSLTNYTFRGDTTYYISGNIYLYGTNIFEGGTVIKYNGTSITLDYPSSIQTQTSAYRPVIFTSGSDSSVGEITPGGYSGGHPALAYYGTVTYAESGSLKLNNFRIYRADEAIYVSGNLNATLENGQFCDCVIGFEADGFNVYAQIENCLFQEPGSMALCLNQANVTMENVTVDGNGDTSLSQAVPYSDAPYTIMMTNCLIGNVWTLSWGSSDAIIGGDYNGFYDTDVSPFGVHYIDFPDNGPYQTAGAGNYYLGDNSFRYFVGTTAIDPALLASLRTKTVYPPDTNSYINTIISTPTTITPSPQVLFDEPNAIALGYHYDRIDYLVDNLTVSNTVLSLANGVVLASCNDIGIQVQGSGTIVSTGTPALPNWLVRYQSVQEEPILLGGADPSLGATICATNTGASGSFQFTHFSVPAGGGYDFYDTGNSVFSNLVLQECELYGGANDFSGGSSASSVILQNNLFDCSSIYASNTSASASLAISNNLFWGTTATIHQPADGVWYAYNNDFDSTAITNSTLNNGYNAYLNCSGYLSSTNATDIFSDDSLAYVAGPLGDFYQPDDSPLINAGSTTANHVGLCAYTVLTDTVNGMEIEETNSIVDIGYHHVAATPDDNLVVSTNITPLQMAQMLMGTGVTIANATYTGTNAARGIFAGGFACNLPIDSGVIFDSGNIADVIGPPSITNPDGEFGNLGGDTDLDNLIGIDSSDGWDPAVLEFDIISSTNSISFQYFFTSEEYTQYVGSVYNDVCGIFIDGTNIAVVPGTSQCVCLNNVSPDTNAKYYVNNPFGANIVNMQYTGLTTLFTAQVTISTNVVHHIKIAIEDVGDDANDSAIFLKAASSCNCN